MSLSIKQLQARARATYASTMPSVYTGLLCLSVRSRKPALVTPTRAPMSPLGSMLFGMCADALLPMPPSAYIGSYDSIRLAPNVGRNLSARA